MPHDERYGVTASGAKRTFAKTRCQQRTSRSEQSTRTYDYCPRIEIARLSLYSYVSRATGDSEVKRIYGRAYYIESIGPETSVRHLPPVFVKPSKLPSIRPT